MTGDKGGHIPAASFIKSGFLKHYLQTLIVGIRGNVGGRFFNDVSCNEEGTRPCTRAMG